MAGSIEYDTMVMAIAGHTGGICRRGDLLEIGVSASAIDRRLRMGLLQQVSRGVYQVVELADRSTPYHRATLTLVESTLSHTTAGALDGFPVEPVDPWQRVDVIVPDHCGQRLSGVVVHRRRRPPVGCDVQVIDGLPVTAPARTIVDLAAVVGPSRLRHIVQTQVRDGRPTPEQLMACFESVARQGVNGIGPLRRLLADLFGNHSMASSALEVAVSELLSSAMFTGFVPQFRPPWYDGRRGIVDFAHPELKLILEADGRRWHRRDQEMTDDRRRDRIAAGHGWTTVRVTWAEITQRPAAILQELQAVIGARSGEQGDAA